MGWEILSHPTSSSNEKNGGYGSSASQLANEKQQRKTENRTQKTTYCKTEAVGAKERFPYGFNSGTPHPVMLFQTAVIIWSVHCEAVLMIGSPAAGTFMGVVVLVTLSKDASR